MEWYVYLVAILGSALAGAINTLAGNGSAITLSLLTEMIGLPGNVANGTNRVGIFAQSVVGTYAFHRNDKLDLLRSRTYILYTILGSLGGIATAILVSNEQFIQVFRILMVLMLGVILVKPRRWLQPGKTVSKGFRWLVPPLFLALGFYGGFIQMGMGIFFLAIMVLGAKYTLIEANAVKIVVVGIYTLIAIFIFQWRGMIDWEIGLLFAVGQTGGGYFTAHYASKYEEANVWAYWILVIVVIAAIVKLFNLHHLLIDIIQM